MNAPRGALGFVSGVFPAFELVAWHVLPPLIEPLVVDHEVPAGVVGVKRVRYVGAGVPAEAQRYPGVVKSLEEFIDVL